ncbi:MAG: hypothetical protein M0D57_16850 [Sphingobacteriales bacterium JAD_PAG50586_3]|nr:MAG: hypothetical protein M0D57_16850 [Sphingobacteriales bacterium JAD_PAG50586_3]
MTGSYVMGKRDGDWKYYNSKGVLLKTVRFKNGETISTTIPPKDPVPPK